MTKHRSKVDLQEKQQLLDRAVINYQNGLSSKELLNTVMTEMYSDADARKIESVSTLLQKANILFLSAGKIFPDYHPKFIEAHMHENHNQSIHVNTQEQSIGTETTHKFSKEILAKSVNKSLKLNMDGERAKLFSLYDPALQQRPCIIFSNDGTASGKSYNVTESFLEPIDPNSKTKGHSNLLFTCPQKNQLDLSLIHIEKARTKLVPINCVFAIKDIVDLELKHWAKQVPLKDIFEKWSNDLSKSRFKNQGGKLKAAINRVIAAKKQVNAAKRDEDLDLKFAEINLYNNENSLRNTLKDIARDLYTKHLQPGSSAQSHKEFFIAEYISADPALIAAVQLVNHAFPFESSKYCPTIMLLTAHKLRTQVNVLTTSNSPLSKDGLKVDQHFIEDIIGHKCFKAKDKDDIERLGSITGKSLIEQQRHLHEKRYKTNEEDYYLKNKITFDLVIDEEHVTYPNFLKLGKHTVLPSDDSISDILSILYRINISALNYKDGYDEKWGDTAVELIDNIKEHFEKRCEISEHCDFDDMLDLFAHKLHSPHIAKQEIEQIINITRNVFALTNKSFYNENALKKLRIKGIGKPGRYTGIRLYYQSDTEDTSPSLYDLFQLILCVFYEVSNANHLNDYFCTFDLQSESEQNRPMRLFFDKIKQSRVDINDLFERASSEDLPIDHFFAYFLPKVVFSIRKLEKLAAMPSKCDEDIYVTFNVEVVEPLPEDSLMRSLINTNNRAVLLSATSGINAALNSSFSPAFFKTFSPHNGKDQLTFYQRNISEVNTFDKLRDFRSQCRNVSFHMHDEVKLTDNHNQNQAAAVATFTDYMMNHACLEKVISTNEFRQREANIVIKHMLAASLNRKHTMILANSSYANKIIQQFAFSHQSRCETQIPAENDKAQQGKTGKDNVDNDKSQYKIFEFSPLKEHGAKLKIILFDSQLNNKVDMVKHLTLTNDDTKIVFIAAHNSAGTGINVFKRYVNNAMNEAINEDFERICLVNIGYWSSIKDRDNGFQHIFNAIYLYQKYANSKENLQFKDVDLNFLGGKNFGFLLRAHMLEQGFTMMQSLGRAERCDTNIDTEVFLSEEILQHMTLFFSFLEREQQSLFIGSLSLLNHRLYELTKQYARCKSFETAEQRDAFKAQSVEAANTVDAFFKDYIRPRINDVRHGDTSAIALNEAVRDISCIKNFPKYIASLQKLPEIQKNNLQGVIDLFDAKYAISQSNVTICRGNNAYELTDLSDGESIYAPMESLIPSYDKVMNNVNPAYHCDKVLRSIQQLRSAIKRNPAIPNPALLPMLKGNVGEYIFDCLLKVNSITPVPLDEVFQVAGTVAYELFDVFIRIGDELVCIDVKKWSSYLDAKDKCDGLLEKSKSKTRQISDNLKQHNLTARFIYANVDLNDNPLNLYSENSSDEPIHFFNCFVKEPSYKETTVHNRKQYNPTDSIAINANMMKLITGVDK